MPFRGPKMAPKLLIVTTVSLLLISAAAAKKHFAAAREDMINTIQALAKTVPVPSGSGEIHASVLAAMREVPRHELVPEDVRDAAYENRPLPIGHGQTISQPYIVALMTALVRPERHHVVLEVGTGSGYQAAVLSRLVARVYSIEIVEPLAMRAAEQLKALGYDNIAVRHGDGYKGWPEHAPFDAIVVTAAPEEVPQALVEQLAVGGKLVVPVGTGEQDMMIITNTKEGVLKKKTIPVRFVPMTGKPTENKGEGKG